MDAKKANDNPLDAMVQSFGVEHSTLILRGISLPKNPLMLTIVTHYPLLRADIGMIFMSNQEHPWYHPHPGTISDQYHWMNRADLPLTVAETWQMRPGMAGRKCRNPNTWLGI